MDSVDSTENRADVRDFLAGRRARLTPRDVGLPSTGRRRVPGLRREEVALLAGVSTEWYTRLEKGHIVGVSASVLDGVARALRFDDEERDYLHELARATQPRRNPDGPATQTQALVPSVQWMLDSMTMSPAFVTNGRWDVLASNALARSLFSPQLESPFSGEQVNVARYHFLDPGAQEFYADWDATSTIVVALLRAEAGRHPEDKVLRKLVEELSLLSPAFRTRWAAHQVRMRNSGRKAFRHPVAGTIALDYHTLELPSPASAGQLLTIYAAEPGSPAEDQLRLLAGHDRSDATPR